jgi:hypothetical protein
MTALRLSGSGTRLDLWFGTPRDEKVQCPRMQAPDPYSCQRRLQARQVRRRQLKALDEGLPRFPGAYLGGLLDIWIRQFGKPRSVGRILIHDVELGQNTAQHRPGPEQSPRWCCGLADRRPDGVGNSAVRHR